LLVGQLLVPTSQPGDIVIVDNFGGHKRQATAAPLGLLEPPVPAGLLVRPHPIGQVFAKLKTLLRKLDARSFEATWRGTGQLLSANECAIAYTRAGYPGSEMDVPHSGCRCAGMILNPDSPSKTIAWSKQPRRTLWPRM
jgi:hypothetical protein